MTSASDSKVSDSKVSACIHGAKIPASCSFAIAHQVAVAFFDNIADMDANAKDDAAIPGHTGVALGHCVLDFDGAVDGVYDAPKFDDCAVAGPFDDPAAVHCDRRIDEITTKGAQASQNTILIRAGEAAVADDHVGGENGHQLASWAFWSHASPEVRIGSMFITRLAGGRNFAYQLA